VISCYPCVDFLGDFVQLRYHRVDRFLNAARQGHRVAPGGNRLQAFAENASARIVAVVVPSTGHIAGFAGRFLDELGAMFHKGHFNSISSATVTASLVTVGAPQPLSRTAFRPRGPSGGTNRSRQLGYASQSFCRASSRSANCFAASTAPFNTVVSVLFRRSPGKPEAVLEF